MEVGRVEPEAGVFDAELAGGLGDAALAKEDGLTALLQGATDDGPFLQSVTEHDAPLLNPSFRRSAWERPAGPPPARRSDNPCRRDAERRVLHSHAERGNEVMESLYRV